MKMEQYPCRMRLNIVCLFRLGLRNYHRALGSSQFALHYKTHKSPATSLLDDYETHMGPVTNQSMVE